MYPNNLRTDCCKSLRSLIKTSLIGASNLPSFARATRAMITFSVASIFSELLMLPVSKSRGWKTRDGLKTAFGSNEDGQSLSIDTSKTTKSECAPLRSPSTFPNETLAHNLSTSVNLRMASITFMLRVSLSDIMEHGKESTYTLPTSFRLCFRKNATII